MDPKHTDNAPSTPELASQSSTSAAASDGAETAAASEEALGQELEGLSERAAHDLEWRILMDRIAAGCRSPAAKQRFFERGLARTRDEALFRMKCTAQALELLEDGDPLPPCAVPRQDEIFKRAIRGASISLDELTKLTRVLKWAEQLRCYANTHKSTAPELATVLTSAPQLNQLLALLVKSIDEDGTLSDHASPGLREARVKVRQIRKSLLKRIDQLLGRYAEILREKFYTEREGRYTLPVRSDAQYRFEGIVLGSSASGGTLYVEPQELTVLGNELKLAEARVEREEALILAELGQAVAEHAEAAEAAYFACLDCDMLEAITRWAVRTQSIPVALTPEPELKLQAIRHPLLIGSVAEVVANDIELTGGSALVVSGPNAGGKTVALKCLGLAVWMTRSGLPLPAGKETRVGWFDDVLTDIGDDQSLVQSLSTFSGHIARLSSILRHALRHTLVLLDEVAAGTDPEEGSALAAAVLEQLVSQGAAVAVTTHYERLKELAAEHPRLNNASVAFDFEAMAPTFRLTLGIPGPSSALAVAARHGMPPAIVARARALLPDTAIDREAAVQRLQAEQAALQRAREQAELESRRQAELVRKLEAERDRSERSAQSELYAEANALLQKVRQARQELERETRQLKRSEKNREQLRAAERAVNTAAQQVAVGSRVHQMLDAQVRKATPATPDPGLPDPSLVRGSKVRLKRLGGEAEVLEPPERGQVRVLMGALKLQVPIAELELLKSPVRAVTRSKTSLSAFVQTHSRAAPVRVGSNTLDLRGARVEEALDQVDSFLDRMLNQGETAGFVLHGHGTGALKAAVRKHLESAALVQSSRPAERDEGGDAFTVFWLRD